MMPTIPIVQRFKRAWNVFTSRSPTTVNYEYEGVGVSYRPDRSRLHYGNTRSIISAIMNQISIDCMNIDIKHVQTDINGRYKFDMDSGLNNALTLDANIDQTGRAFIQDAVLSLLDEGVVAIVPVQRDPMDLNNILTLRTGKIVAWYPTRIKVRCYDERDGQYKEIFVNKSETAIVENPLFGVMNEPNGTAKRLARKLALLDSVDESAYGKIDLLIQVPYTVKNPLKKAYADQRVKDVTVQLQSSRYGVGYIDATEKVIQLNRSLDNHLVDQIDKLQKDLFSQLGLTEEVFNGTADEKTMLNYNNRTIKPIMDALVEEMTRKFLTKNARTRGQKIMYFMDPFKLVPVNNIADIADKFTRNAILSSNELRGIIGFKPVDDVKADELSNKNLNEQKGQENPVVDTGEEYDESGGEDSAETNNRASRFLSQYLN